MPTPADLLDLLHQMNGNLDGDVSLAALASRAGWSPFHLHRAFRRLTRETPKQYTMRLRLDRAAARLAIGSDRVLDVALDQGFASHEVFSRAFRRRFARSPEQFRAALSAASPEARACHAEQSLVASPCLGLYHLSLTSDSGRFDMPTTVTRTTLQPQPALIVRRRVARAEIPAAIADCLGQVFVHMQQTGSTLAGRPFSRYPSVGPGLMTIEVGVPIAADGTGGGSVEAVQLPGGPAALAVHMGPYDRLTDTYAAIERWMDKAGTRAAGAPWESYVTDPAEFPDPANWRTDVYWPIAE
jgi:AraC family transcriptional regulator